MTTARTKLYYIGKVGTAFDEPTLAALTQGFRPLTSEVANSAPAQLPIPISHPDKIFWPNEGYTKLDLAEYCKAIFPKLLPYVKDRMLAIKRCPDGMLGKCFFQKQKPKSMPPGTPTKRFEHVTNPGRFTDYVVGGSLVTQLALANLGCIAVHIMASRMNSPRQPDWICIDIDPESGLFADAARAGLHVKAALVALKLVSYPKTSGSRGLHVLVPIRVEPDADQVLAFAKSFVDRVASAHPHEMTIEHSVVARRVRVYRHWSRLISTGVILPHGSADRTPGVISSRIVKGWTMPPVCLIGCEADGSFGSCANWLAS